MWLFYSGEVRSSTFINDPPTPGRLLCPSLKVGFGAQQCSRMGQQLSYAQCSQVLVSERAIIPQTLAKEYQWQMQCLQLAKWILLKCFPIYCSVSLWYYIQTLKTVTWRKEKLRVLALTQEHYALAFLKFQVGNYQESKYFMQG